MWHKSSRSNAQPQCVEINAEDDAIAVRDSKHPDGPILRFPRPAWATFIEGVQRHEFDVTCDG